jgi:hypothetical protein
MLKKPYSVSIKRPLFFAILSLLLASMACRAAEQAVFGTPTPTPSSTPSPTPTFTPTLPPSPTPTATPTPSFEETCPDGDCIEACLEGLGLDLVNESQHSHRDPNFKGSSGQILVSYKVYGNKLLEVEKKTVYSTFKSYQEDTDLHQRIWDYYSAIIPTKNRSTISHFLVFTDGKQNILAYVAQSGISPEKWVISVDVVDAETPQDLTYTLVHEFAHLLTLGPDQVIPSEAIFENPGDENIWRSEYEACETYFPGEGCSVADAYIDSFFTTYWDEIYREWIRIQRQPNQDSYIESIQEFYEVYQDRFVTEYAVTSPEEDIAESFTFFVLTKKPEANKISDQKVLFFYEYPELVSLRLKIIKGICRYNQ